MRGTNRSHGDYTLFSAQQEQDFVEIAEYLARHYPDANGTAALAGESYLGTDVLAAGRYIRPGSPIKALFAATAGSDWYREMMVPSEIPSTFGVGYGTLDQIRDGGIAPSYNSDAASGGPLTYDGEFWQSRAPINSAQEIVRAHVPTLMVSGEGDYPAMGSLEWYVALQNASQGRSIWAPMAPNQPANGNYQLIWGTQTDANMAGYDYHPYELEWFDTFLKGQNTGVQDTSTPLHLYEWKAQQWVDAADYPLTRSYTRYYLNGSSTSQAPYAMNNGGLSTTPPTSTTSADAIKWAPPASPPTPNSASNILDYTSEPFSTEALLAGPITARIYASSTTRNTMLVATLIDVAPDGTTTSVYHIWEPDGVLLGTARAVDPSRSWYDSDWRTYIRLPPLHDRDSRACDTRADGAHGHHALTEDVGGSPWPPSAPADHNSGADTVGPDTAADPLDDRCHVLDREEFAGPSYLNLPVLPLNAFTPDTAYAQTSYTDEPQDPAGVGSGTTFLGPQFNIPPLGQ